MTDENEAQALEDQLIEDIAKFAHDPEGYIRYAFPWGVKGTVLEKENLYEWHIKLCDSIKSKLLEGEERLKAISETMSELEPMPVREATASGHGIGKSAIVAMLIMWAISTCLNTRGIVTANTEAQLTKKTWPEIAKWHGLAINSHWFDCNATSLAAKGELGKNWRIDAVTWSLTNLEAFAGLHNKGNRIIIIFDEGSSIPDKVWEVAEGALTDKNTEIIWLVFGNPTRNSGQFRECFRRDKHLWTHRQIDSRTVPGTNKTQIEEWRIKHGEDSDFFKIRVRGMFPVTSELQYISTEDVDAAYNRHLRKEQYDFAPVVITCDPSWTGADALVISMRQGLYFKILRTIPKNDNDVQVANILAVLQDEHRADAVFIDMGYGTGIYSVGQSMGRKNWRLVNFGDASPDPGFLNMRAWIYGQVKNWLKEGGALPPDQELYDELTSIETKDRADGKIVLESKQDMKARGLPSPNKADSLAISFAFPVQKATMKITAPTNATILAAPRSAHNPFNRLKR